MKITDEDIEFIKNYDNYEKCEKCGKYSTNECECGILICDECSIFCKKFGIDYCSENCRDCKSCDYKEYCD